MEQTNEKRTRQKDIFGPRTEGGEKRGGEEKMYLSRLGKKTER